MTCTWKGRKNTGKPEEIEPEKPARASLQGFRQVSLRRKNAWMQGGELKRDDGIAAVRPSYRLDPRRTRANACITGSSLNSLICSRKKGREDNPPAFCVVSEPRTLDAQETEEEQADDGADDRTWKAPRSAGSRKSFALSSCSAAQAMQSAPSVERGEASTRWAPTLIEEIMPTASAPGTVLRSPGTSGRKAGMTTPEELE